MIPLFRILRLLIAASPWSMARGAVLAVLVLLMGAALLGLSGWFITATGLAGLAGIGIAFDVFRPSAGVRLLALGRAAARYGERLLTHDATLRALAALRVDLLKRVARRDGRQLQNLRGEAALTRIVSDVDALDGVILRLFLPVLAAAVTHAVAFAALWWLAGAPVALSVLVGYVPAGLVVLVVLGARSLSPSRTAEEDAQRLRRGVIDLIRDRESSILTGALAAEEEALLQIDRTARAAIRRLDGQERRAGLILALAGSVALALALLAGDWVLSRGSVDAAIAAIGVFVALALGEAFVPLKRGVTEVGRIIPAAERVLSDSEPDARTPFAETKPLAGSSILDLRIGDKGLSLGAGDAAVLTGASGIGKTTLLLRIAGLSDMTDARILILGRDPSDWAEEGLRDVVAMVSQRSVLIAGTVRDNLALTGVSDEQAMWAALEAVALADTMRNRDGLDTLLGEGGAGLSGGETRRMALARAVLRRPKLLLLDEPTEGLDTETAARVLAGIRATLPDTAILAALHRDVAHPLFAGGVSLEL